MTENPKKTDQSASRTADAGQAQLQEQFDKEADQGYRGYHADPTPNSAYTVAGVVAGEPTPETDADAYEKTAARRRDVDKKGGAR